MHVPSTIGELLDQKGRRLIAIDRDSNLTEGCQLMADHRVGSLLVLGEGGRLEGICTWHDMVEAFAGGVGGADLYIGDIMTHNVVTTTEDADLKTVSDRMVADGIRHMPVVDGDGKLVGLITRIDALTQHLAKAEAAAG